MEQQLPETLGSAVAGAKELSTTYADDEKLNRGDDVHVHSAPNSVVSYGPQTQESGRGTDQQVPAGLGLGAEGSCVRVNGTSSGLAPPSAAAGAGLDAPPVYRLYKARFSGAVGVIALSLVTGMCQPWFGPIANDGEWVCLTKIELTHTFFYHHGEIIANSRGRVCNIVGSGQLAGEHHQCYVSRLRSCCTHLL